MARPLTKDEIEVRVGQKNRAGDGASLLLYKTARTDMKLLDEMFGPMNWQCSYECIDGKMFCTISVWDEKKGYWISKSNVGSESNVEAEKGEASDAMKRAGFLWGIGRELYDTPFIWVNLPDKDEKNPHFEVKELGHDANGKINRLVIHYKKGSVSTKVFSWGSGSSDDDTSQKDEPPKAVPPKEKPQKAEPPKTEENGVRPQAVFNKLMAKLGYDKSKPSSDPYNERRRKMGKDILHDEFHIDDLNKASQSELANAYVGIDAVRFDSPEYFIDDGV